MRPIVFIVPGRLDQLTGGYLFDRRIVDGLRADGRMVTVRELAGRHPDVDDAARAAAREAFAALPAGAAVVIDGLALPAFADLLEDGARRDDIIAFVHHPLALETGLSLEASDRYAWLEGRLLQEVRGVICPSLATATSLVEYGVADTAIRIAPPGTDRPTAPPKKRPAGPLRLLCVASLTPRKGQLDLIEALAALRQQDWRLTLIGSSERDPAYAEEVRRAIARHRLGERVTLAGERPPEHLSAAYRDADLFVLASLHEGYGMAFAEAMAHGLPIVGTTAGAVAETVPAAASLLVPPGDVEALSAALGRVLGSDKLRARLAAAAQRAGEGLPDWPSAVRGWAAALDSLLG